MVFRSKEFFKFEEIFINSGFVGFTLFVILSINLREDLNQEIFKIKEGGVLVTYIEIGILYFIKMLNENPLRFFVLNKKTLYIFRDSTYSDICSILNSIGSEGINLARGSSQKSHKMSKLEFRFMFYLLILAGDKYQSLMKLNSFDELPKLRYLPRYKN